MVDEAYMLEFWEPLVVIDPCPCILLYNCVLIYDFLKQNGTEGGTATIEHD
jgi:hypothetical protein